MRATAFIAAVLASALASGCMVGPDYHPPDLDTPHTWGELSPPSEVSQQPVDDGADQRVAAAGRYGDVVDGVQ